MAQVPLAQLSQSQRVTEMSDLWLGMTVAVVDFALPTATTFQIRMYNKTTNINAGAGTFVINLKEEE